MGPEMKNMGDSALGLRLGSALHMWYAYMGYKPYINNLVLDIGSYIICWNIAKYTYGGRFVHILVLYGNNLMDVNIRKRLDMDVN